MIFLVDAQLPPALAKLLTAQGHRADHVHDRLWVGASDNAIWNAAIADAAVIVTKDADFAHRRAQSATGPIVLWVRTPNTTRRDLLTWFTRLLPDVIEGLERCDPIIEVT